MKKTRFFAIVLIALAVLVVFWPRIKFYPSQEGKNLNVYYTVLNVRENPDLNSATIGELVSGQEVTLTGNRYSTFSEVYGDWVEISYPVHGWVVREALREIY